MSNVIALPIKVKHLVDTSYCGDICEGCAIEKAMCELMSLDLRRVEEAIHYLDVNDYSIDGRLTHRTIYGHDRYGWNEFRDDKELALANAHDPEKVIRKLTLIKYEP